MDESTIAAMGIRFDSEPVSKRHGENNTDKVVIGNGEICVVVDLDKFRKTFGDAPILGMLDGTSLRVMSQAASRRVILANPGKTKLEKSDLIRDAIINQIRGVKNRAMPQVVTRTVEVKVYNLPDGSVYTGADEAEYQAAYMAALIDMGTPPEVAQMIGASQKL